ncbi:MAG: hypothetical protein Q9217_000827 [Psora testacea]
MSTDGNGKGRESSKEPGELMRPYTYALIYDVITYKMRNLDQSPPPSEHHPTRRSTRQAVQASARRRRRSVSSDRSHAEPRPERSQPVTKRAKPTTKVPTGSSGVQQKVDRRRRPKGRLAEKIANVGGNVGANFRARGETTTIKGKLFFKDENFPGWTRGEYHQTHRKRFIREDAKLGRFTCRPERGQASGDETSFLPYQKNWSSYPVTWDNITDEQGRKVFREPNRPADLERWVRPGWWRLDDAVLLDQDNHPLRDIPGLNRAFSSALEGWRLDALRKRYPHTTIQDFRGRMPHTREVGKRTLPLQRFEAFTNRAYRFRKAHNIPEWNIRGTVVMGKYEGIAFRSHMEETLPRGRDGNGNMQDPSSSENEEEDNDDARSEDSDYWQEFPQWTEQDLLEATEAPIPEEESQEDMVPLFATVEDENLARLQHENLTSPQAVMFEWVRGRGAATSVYLVLRPREAPRYVDPATGEVHDNVAVMSQEDIARLEEEVSIDVDLKLRWFQ